MIQTKFSPGIAPDSSVAPDSERGAEWYRALTESSADAITVVSAEGRIRYHSPNTPRLLGERWGGQGISVFSLLHPEDRARAQECFTQLLQAPGSCRDAELRLRHAQGHFIWAHVTGRNLLAHPAVRGIVLSAHDITERKQDRQALEDRVAMEEMVADLSRAFVRLSGLDAVIPRTLAAVGSFTGADRSHFLQCDSADRMSHTHEWCAPGVPSRPLQSPRLAASDFAWALAQLRRGQSVCLTSRGEQKGWLKARGIQALLAAPVCFNGELLGVLGFETVRTAREWSSASGQLLQMVGEMLAQVLMRERASRALRHSEELSRATLNALPAHIAVLDQQGVILAVNEAWTDFARRNDAAAPHKVSVGADYLGVCRQAARRGDASARLAIAGIKAVLTGRKRLFVHEYACHGPQTRRWFMMTVASLGQRGGAVLTHLNITERKQAEEQLREFNGRLEASVRQRTAALLESETTARALLENPVDAVYLLDRRGRLLDLNVTMARLLRCRRDDLIGRNLFDLLPAEIATQRRRKLAEVFRTGQPLRFEDERHGHWVDQVYTPIRTLGGTVAKVAVAARDATARKNAELGQARFAAIVESTGDAVTAMARDGTITDWNRAAESLYGYRARDVLGKPMSLLVPPERLPELWAKVRRLLRGEALQSHETERLHRSGRRLPVSLTMSPVRDGNGKIIRIAAVARDISERKRLESEILRVSEMERQRLGRDLHDGLSQQLTAAALLSGALEQALQAEGRAEAEQVAKVAVLVREAMRTSRDLARALYATSLQTSGLGTALEELAGNVRELFEVDCRFLGDRELRVADENLSRQLYRIAQEASYNAAKHSRCRRVRIKLCDWKRHLKLTVTDDGAGIAERRLQGGMGISIMCYRADLIGAKLVIQRRPKKGTTITCTVPKA